MESTLAIIKPDAMARADEILQLISSSGFTIGAKEKLSLSEGRARDFYAEHASQPFFKGLVSYMSSGPVMAMVLKRENAITEWRNLLGPTDPIKAREEAPSSVRAKYGTSVERNAAHGSDSKESAEREIEFLFPELGVDRLSPKEYLTKTVLTVLTKALTEMCRVVPEEPVVWLGNYLISKGKEKVRRRKIIFVLGGPGSGKGTQCRKIVEEFKFDHFSAGDLLRGEVASGSEQGKMIGEMIKEGKIVPGEITLGLLKNAINKSTAPGVLIDGFPRKLDQAGSFEKDVSDFDFALFMDCPEEEMERRLVERGQTSGRTDDNSVSIRKRFKTFVETSMPVIEYYEAKGKVHRIDATRSVDDVYASIRKHIEAL